MLRVRRILLDLFPEPSYVYVYRPEIPDIVEAPYGLKQLVPAVNLAYVGHEQVQQVEFLYRKVHGLPMAYYAAGIYVYRNVPGGDLHLGSLLAGARPAKYGLYSGLYLEYVERLCHVVVRAVFEAQYLIHILALCSEHDYWHVALLPHRLAYFYSAHLGQHNVQQYKIEIAVLYLFKGLFAVSGGIRLVSVGFQRKLEPLYYQRLVVHKKNSLCHIKPSCLSANGHSIPMVKIISYYL